MLGENHSLHHEFPEHHDLIDKLMKENMHFKKIADEYNSLDKEIRTLEENNSPIDDIMLHEMKKKRSALKDEAYHMLQA
ncbi:MAG: DUF465 domain-containing protein [Gammaproteobacteria bacterium]|nr:DUF465 domain-containing protein [Gammaproteobacteria bacterium]